MASTRDVSPLGTSKFERPYSPPPSLSTSSTSSPTATWTTPFTPFRFSKFPRYSNTPYARYSTSTNQTSQTGTTAATSVDSAEDVIAEENTFKEEDTFKEDNTCSSAACTLSEDQSSNEEPDDWFAKFRDDNDPNADSSDECPDGATLAAVNHILIYDANGIPHRFDSLYRPEIATHQRQLLVFIRHFYCGACQAYVRALADGITAQEYFSVPVPTSITIIGCGKPDLIPLYKKLTGCPFQIFAEPSRQVFKKLGMRLSLNLGGSRPEYMSDTSLVQWAAGQVSTINSSLKDPEGIRKKQVVRGGNVMQIGGEFLLEDGEVIWCHRMKNYRNHAEVPRIRKVLELDE